MTEVGELQETIKFLEARVQELLKSNNRQLEVSRRKDGTIKLIRDMILILTETELNRG